MKALNSKKIKEMKPKNRERFTKPIVADARIINGSGNHIGFLSFTFSLDEHFVPHWIWQKKDTWGVGGEVTKNKTKKAYMLHY